MLPNGDVLTSFLRQHKIAIIDKQTKEIKWIWGGDGKLGHQHDPNMLANGNILVFDNGTHRLYNMVNFSRVLEINPKNGEIVWEYKDETTLHFHSSFISGAQRLPNGNTLICEGGMGRFFEVTPDKEVVWEYIYPFRNEEMSEFMGLNNSIFRAYRYGFDYPAFKGKDLDPNKVTLTLRATPNWKEKMEVKQKKEEELKKKAAEEGKPKSAFEERLKSLGY